MDGIVADGGFAMSSGAFTSALLDAFVGSAKHGFAVDRTKFRESFAADVTPYAAAFMADSQVPWGLEALRVINLADVLRAIPEKSTWATWLAERGNRAAHEGDRLVAPFLFPAGRFRLPCPPDSPKIEPEQRLYPRCRRGDGVVSFLAGQ